jgi:hypothetical protein
MMAPSDAQGRPGADGLAALLSAAARARVTPVVGARTVESARA